MERKIYEIKNFYENEKQEIKRQHSRMYQDLLEETDQVKIDNFFLFEKIFFFYF
jgi:L-rhamnose mutarotase